MKKLVLIMESLSFDNEKTCFDNGKRSFDNVHKCVEVQKTHTKRLIIAIFRVVLLLSGEKMAGSHFQNLSRIGFTFSKPVRNRVRIFKTCFDICLTNKLA